MRGPEAGKLANDATGAERVLLSPEVQKQSEAARASLGQIKNHLGNGQIDLKKINHNSPFVITLGVFNEELLGVVKDSDEFKSLRDYLSRGGKAPNAIIAKPYSCFLHRTFFPGVQDKTPMLELTITVPRIPG